MAEHHETMKFNFELEPNQKVREVLDEVYQALQERGYNQINQLVGYILSGDPTYITSHKNARTVIRRVERDEILEELFKVYLENK
ncbi:MAG: IreB family regulatory phosphoprotein [Clostridiales bacterium]|nr:IreB family regulatory phosphoprotein [Clostridiales bacterium]